MTSENQPPEGAAAVEAAISQSSDAEIADLARMMIEGEKLARDRGEATAFLSDFQDRISRLSTDAFNIVTATDAYQRFFSKVAPQSGVQPGEKVFDANGRELGYVPYSYEWCMEHFPLVQYVAQRTNTVSWNGVEVRFVEGYTYTQVPKVFVDIELESIRKTAEATGRGPDDVLKRLPADGYTRTTGWRKDTAEDLARSGEWVER